MNIKITPSKLMGTVKIPPSKSVAHRMIIAAALAKGTSKISNIYLSKDIIATIDAMKALGAEIKVENGTATVKGIEKPPAKATIDCCESGSTLRFLIPVACALGVECTFVGKGKLPLRPITPYIEEFPGHGCDFDFSNAGEGETLPCTVKGKLSRGKFYVSGSISSQFITGLLFALPLLQGDSEIILTSHLESKPYVDITLGCLRDFGCEIKETQQGYYVKGSQTLKPFNGEVEGDYSQAAFFRVANSLGCNINISGLNINSYQGDKQIMEICDNSEAGGNGLKAFTLDCSDIPDLVPVLTVLACFCKGKSEINNVARLRIKECDRLEAISDCLNRLGAKVTEYEDRLEIEGVESLSGGEVDCYNDHRIPMAMSVAAVKCSEPLVLKGAECISKSYPSFFDDYRNLGGIAEEISE